MTSKIASNIRKNTDKEIDSIIEDSAGSSFVISNINKNLNVSVPLTGSYFSSSALRIGISVNRESASIRSPEETGTGGVKIGSVTLLEKNASIVDFDAGRSGTNVIDSIHFLRMNKPLISVNRENFLNSFNRINHVAAFNNYGVSKLFKTYNNETREAIPFEDFPGILDPVAFVDAGDYILQYMIVTDLTRNIDKFIDPDDLNGVIEVFDVRNSFANTSITDFDVKGIKGSMSNENFYSIGQGAAPIENKYEIDQKSCSIFEDSQDVLYGEITFSPRLGYSASGSFAQDAPVSDENRVMSPYVESSGDRKFSFGGRLREFIGGSYTGVIETEDEIPEMGTRFRSSNSGFIGSPKYDIIPSSRFINPGTDSIAFVSTNRN